jgi:hypothetical protein
MPIEVMMVVPSPRSCSNYQTPTRCDRTSQVIRPTYSCPCPTDIRHPIDVPKSLDKFGIFFPFQERFTRLADITEHRRYRNAEAIT